MKKLVLTIIFYVLGFLLFCGYCYSQGYTNVKLSGSKSTDFTRRLITDVSGNMYVLGAFTDSITFDKSGTKITLAGAGDYDYFLAKYDCQRNFVWARSMGSSQNDLATYWGAGLAVDKSGNIYITASFQDKIKFETTAGGSAISLTAKGEYDIFFAKYDANGKALWATLAGGSGTDESSSMKMDADGKILICGEFNNTTYFMDTKGNSTALKSNGHRDIFIAKYNDDGSLNWVKSYGDTAEDVVNGMEMDKAGNIFITGNYGYGATQISFGSLSLKNSGGMGMFIAKLDSKGSALWLQGSGENSDENGADITTDDFGNVYLTGSYNTSAKLSSADGKTLSVSAKGDQDIFTAKYDANGNLIWLQSTGGTEDDMPYKTVLKDNSIYIAGTFISSFSFGNSSVSSAGDFDIFTLKYDTSGKAIWAMTAGGKGDDFAYDISLAENGNPIIGGFIYGNVSFGSLSATAAKRDMFTAEIQLNRPSNIFKDGGFSSDVIYSCPGQPKPTFSTDSFYGVSYAWYKNDTLLSATNFKFTPTESGKYYVVVNHCSSKTDTSKSVDFQILKSIKILTPHTNDICVGSSLKMEVVGCNLVKWFPGKFLTDSTSNTPVAKPTSDIVYYVTASNPACNTTVKDSIKIRVNLMPDAGFDTIRVGNKITLNAKTAGLTYAWEVDGKVVDTKQKTEINLSGNKPHSIHLTATNAAGCSSEDSIEISAITTINSYENNKHFSAYPNPFTNEFNITSSLNQLTKYTLTDITGKVVLVGEVSSNQNSINTQNLGEGMYILRVETERKNITIKLTKHIISQ
ncbi:MAG: T9SS type A sorting domain-containing protein [Bacteroidetes bacterium]|nr:T9SS type A sorting domain-containing protein [Bacteroidota bacterium]